MGLTRYDIVVIEIETERQRDRERQADRDRQTDRRTDRHAISKTQTLVPNLIYLS